MNLIARARRFFAHRSNELRRRLDDDDPADMGTAFGLDAITIPLPELPDDAAARARAPAQSRLQHRLHRRPT